MTKELQQIAVAELRDQLEAKEQINIIKSTIKQYGGFTRL